MTLTADYDTYMMSSIYSLRETGRAASQGKINVVKKDFDPKILVLPNIDSKWMDRSLVPQHLFDKSSIE